MQTLRVRLALAIGSIALATGLELVGLPAGLLLGPMIAAIVFASRGNNMTLPPVAYMGAQAIVGLMIAPSLNLSVMTAAAHDPAIYAGATFGTIGSAIAVGWVLARLQILPGKVAIWGVMPGAATAMVLMARDEGADWQLVAVMTYLRVICVATLASLLAALVAVHGVDHPLGHDWFPKLHALSFGVTVAIGIIGIVLGRLVRIPAASLMGPMIVGAIAGATGYVQVQLPGWLLAPAYLIVGWRIGLGFTPDIVTTARGAALQILLAVVLLVTFCAICGLVVAGLTGKDLMTAYLATSPGGADSVAIIASATPVDVPFVMTMQVLRFVTVLIVGPPLARFIGNHVAQ